MQREGFGPRLAAAIIDGLILAGIGFLLGLVFGGSIALMFGAGGNTAGSQNAAAVAGIGFAIAVIILGVGYTLMEVFMAATPGKMALGLIIADERGVPATRDQLFKRWAIKNSGQIIQWLALLVGVAIIATIGKIVGLIIVIGCFFTLGAAKQAFHDKAAKTAVFKKAAIAQYQPRGFDVMPPTAPPPVA
jgi:uncharacterized RDD family membrane protein YckC